MPARHDPPTIDPRAEALAAVIVGRYRPLTARRRLLIAVLAVVTAIGVVLLLLDPPGGVQRTRHRPADKVLCVNGQPPGCIEDKIGVILLPPSLPASAPAPGASR